MRLCGFFLFLLFLKPSTVWSDDVISAVDSCFGAKQAIRAMGSSVKENFNERDVAGQVESIEWAASKCKIPVSEFGWGPGVFEYWKKTGYQAEIAKAKEQIESDAKFRDVGPELTRYREFAAKLGLSSEKTEIYISKYREQGLAAVSAEEKNCQPSVDLRNQVLGDVRDQDSIGWCYAFAAADLLTYKLGKKISAADVAMNYNDGWFDNIQKKFGKGEQDFDGASTWGIESAISNMNAKGGACLETNLRSEDNGNSSIMFNLTQIDRLKRTSAVTNSASCPAAVQRVFPNIQSDEILKISERATRASFISMLSDKACAPRLSLKNIKVETVTPSLTGDKKEIFKEIDQQLGQKNILAIGYDSALLFDRNSKASGGHESTIVGRRFSKEHGECEYLVRNSWGRSCAGYDPTYTCEAGNIWLPKSAVSKAVLDVTFIK